MFTGIVETVGKISSVVTGRGGTIVKVASDIDSQELNIGESIAVNGACLTVIGKGKNSFDVEISPETLSKSTLKNLSMGDHVNIERSLKIGERLSGHIVYGHLDGIATIGNIRKYGDSAVFEIHADDTIMKYIVYKGSVALDGVSLTVSKGSRRSFEVTLLPYTFEQTNMKYAKRGSEVNVEIDIIGKYVEKFLNRAGDSRLFDLLGKSGYLKEE